MSAIDDLSPDQRAVLQLVLRQGRSYDQLAGMLGIERDAVAARAHAGLEALAPDAARRLSPERRGQIADYLLGQQDEAMAIETRSYLAGSASARAFARLVADAIEPVARDPLPELPAPATAAPAQPTPPPPPGEREEAGDIDTPPPVPAPEPAAPSGPRSSRLGGVLILAAVAAIIAVVVIFIVNHNSGDDNGTATQAATTSTTTPATTTPSTTSTTPVTPKAQINLHALQTGSKAVGLAQVVTQGGQEAIALAAQNVAANQNNAYAVWLYSSQSDVKFLGWINSKVGSNGQFTALIPPGSLPSNATHFKYLLVSLEPVSQNQKTAPSKPTQLVMRGKLKL
jgi:Sigma-70, region 4